jgi:hypothetical protein
MTTSATSKAKRGHLGDNIPVESQAADASGGEMIAGIVLGHEIFERAGSHTAPLP